MKTEVTVAVDNMDLSLASALDSPPFNCIHSCTDRSYTTLLLRTGVHRTKRGSLNFLPTDQNLTKSLVWDSFAENSLLMQTSECIFFFLLIFAH